jgi:hypothetical protein
MDGYISSSLVHAHFMPKFFIQPDLPRDCAHARANQQSINRIERHLGIEETDWPAFPPSPPRDFPAEWEHYDVGDDDDEEEEEDE